MTTSTRLVICFLANVLVFAGSVVGQETESRASKHPEVVAAAKAFARAIAGNDDSLYQETLIKSLNLASSVKQETIVRKLESEIDERNHILRAMRQAAPGSTVGEPTPVERSGRSASPSAAARSVAPSAPSTDFVPRVATFDAARSRFDGAMPRNARLQPLKPLIEDPQWRTNMMTLIDEQGVAFTPRIFNPNDNESRPTKDLLDCVSICHPGSSCCTGTLLSENVVLTAAHCLDCDSSHIYIGYNSNIPSTGRLFKIREIIAHPDNDPDQYINDIAVVILDEPIGSSVARPRELATTAEVTAARTFTAVGFGNTDQGNFGIKLEAPIALRRLYSKEISAGGAGFDSCQGDSGGPLYIKSNSGRFHLAGVTSRGGACGTGGIYVRVDAYRGWIDSMIARGRGGSASQEVVPQRYDKKG